MTHPPLATPDGAVYEVFARFKKDEPLRHIGSVAAPNPEMAKMYAYKLYDEWTWSAMYIVERKNIIHLVETK